MDDKPDAAEAGGRAVTDTALVLAGGGVLGIAWQLGLIAALRDEHIDLRAADDILGTSAGAVVGAQLATGQLDAAIAMQHAPTSEVAVQLDMPRYFRELAQIRTEADTAAEAAQRMARLRYVDDVIEADQRRAIIAARLPAHDWPEQALRVVAIDAATGERTVFSRATGVPLVDAVAASCALPGIWPLASIGGRRYMDGGIYSISNADLARSHRRAVIVVPVGPNAGFDATLNAELAAFEEPPIVVRIDADSLDEIGPNAQDPTRRSAAVDAGRRQGRRIAGSLHARLTHTP